MAFSETYIKQPEASRLNVDSCYDSVFDWNYKDERDDLLKLYDKGQRQQWIASDRIDWSLELDEDNPIQGPEHLYPLFGSDMWAKMTAKEKARAFRYHQSWTTSQFLHGEQGALLCAAKIVQTVPDLEAKFYASTQVIDEARHVEAYKKLVEKFGVSFPITGPLQTLIGQVITDRRWDMTYLGMQVVIEGLALAAFAGIRDYAQNQLAAQVNAYVMQDEARHVAFGRLALREYYPQLTQAERDEREEFLIEACYLMRDRFEGRDVWEALGLPVEACVEHQRQSAGMQQFRSFLFTRIVPVVKDIGLWGPKVRSAYADMGILGFADIDIDALQANDEQVALAFDARRKHVEEVASLAAAE